MPKPGGLLVNGKNVIKTVGKTLSDHAPAILTGLSVVGTVGTVVLGIRATPHAIRDIMDAESERTEPLTNVEKVRLVWRDYIPTALSGVATVGCILGANSIHAKRQAAAIGLYTLTDTAFREYQSKIVEQLGEKKERKVRDDIAIEAAEKSPPVKSKIIMTGKGQHLCRDSLSGQYFMSDIEAIRKAQNDINAQCINDMYASQNDFYRLIGLPPNVFGEEQGWRSDHMLDIEFTSYLSEDDVPALLLNYRLEPIRGYYKINP